jgi:hypothetical protein
MDSLPEDIGGHDKDTPKHLWGHVDSITLSFKLLLFTVENGTTAKTGTFENLIRRDTGVSTR